MLERHPVLKAAVANQYQAILVAGAAAFSALTLSPLPFLLLAGAEMMVAPFLFERIKRRLEIEKKYQERQVEALSQDDQYTELPHELKARYDMLKKLCGQIQRNYRGLSPASQMVLADQTSKFNAILASCLRRLWLLKKYDEMTRSFDEKRVLQEIDALKVAVVDKAAAPRVREALQQTLSIKQKLLETVERNQANRLALASEVDSLEALLQLLFQKSVAATDAEAFTAEIDDVLAQAEADAASVQEMEQLMGAMPELLDARVREPLKRPTLDTRGWTPPGTRDGGPKPR